MEKPVPSIVTLAEMTIAASAPRVIGVLLQLSEKVIVSPAPDGPLPSTSAWATAAGREPVVAAAPEQVLTTREPVAPAGAARTTALDRARTTLAARPETILRAPNCCRMDRTTISSSPISRPSPASAHHHCP